MSTSAPGPAAGGSAPGDRVGLVFRGNDRETAPESLRTALAGHFRVETGRAVQERLAYLDTPDHRLRSAGLGLVQPGRSHRLILLGRITPGQDGQPRETGSVQQQLTSAPTWPALPDTLPAGAVRDAVTAVSGLRALVVATRTRTTVTQGVLRNSDDKIVARFGWRETELTAPAAASTARPALRVSLTALRGYHDEVGYVVEMLRGTGHFVEETVIEYAEVLTAAAPVRTGPPVMTADTPADLAIARALQRFSADIRINVTGTVDDVDTEFLHDLRVAVRRVRSVLKRAGDVLPDIAGRYAQEFRWVGQITTPVRDLDVFALELPQLREIVSDRAALDSFAAHVLRQRVVARRFLVKALCSQRFSRLLDDFDSDLATAVANPTPGSTIAAELARDRIGAAYRRVSTRARALNEHTPAEDVHDLRKRGKDLRYVLEVFNPLCRRDDYAVVLSHLKKFQDVLGEFQDSQVQVVALHRIAQEMLDAGERRAEPVLAVGELAAHFHAGQLRARSQLDRHHADYLHPATNRRVKRLVAT